MLLMFAAALALQACKTSEPASGIEGAVIEEGAAAGEEQHDHGAAMVGSSSTCPKPFMSVDTSACTEEALQDYGLSPQDPAEWGFGAGTRTLWFGRLMCGDGTMPDIHRAGNIGPAPNPSSSPKSDVEMATVDILDKWVVQCPGEPQPTVVYHNMYRCGSPCPPRDFKLLPGEAFRAYIDSQRALEDNEHERAYELAQRAHELAPDYELTTLWLAIQKAEHNAPDEALALYERAAELNPHDPFARIQLAELLVDLGQYARATPLIDQLLGEVAPGHEEVPRLTCLKATTMLPDAPEDARELAKKACEAGARRCC